MNRQLRIERRIIDASFDGAGSERWQLVANAWAEVQDVLPSRAEKSAGGMSSATRPARVRMRFREDITSDMRLVMGVRVMQIISGPVEMGRREAIEMMAEEYQPAGGGS